MFCPGISICRKEEPSWRNYRAPWAKPLIGNCPGSPSSATLPRRFAVHRPKRVEFWRDGSYKELLPSLGMEIEGLWYMSGMPNLWTAEFQQMVRGNNSNHAFDVISRHLPFP